MRIFQGSRLFAFMLLFLAFPFLQYAQGLRFVGLEQSIEKRTSFDVFGGRGHSFQNCLDMKFQLYLYPEESARFGYFFRLKDKGADGFVWNMSYERNPQADKLTIRFNEEGEFSLIRTDLHCAQVPELEWIDVSVHIDLDRGTVRLMIGDNSAEGKFEYGKDVLPADLIFGVSDYVTDVPSFAIRNLSIGDSRKTYSFPFTESRGNVAHDSDRRSRGIVTNPFWMVTLSAKWEKIGTLTMPTCAGSGYDQDRHRFYYYNESGVYLVDLIENKTTLHPYANACPVDIGAGNNFYYDGVVTAYAAKNFSDKPQTAIARLDLDTFMWTAVSTRDLGIDIYHHTGFIDPSDSTYYIFGGNGWPTYNGKFFSLGKGSPDWREVDGWQYDICPRFFVSSGVDDGYAYFFGGMGNSSGEQVIGKKYFYDFHRIDLATGQHELLWTLPTPEANYVPVSTMVVEGGFAYTLCYPEYISDSKLTLHRFDIETGEDVQLDCVIPMRSDKLFTNAKLYFDRQLEKLFVITQTFSDDVESQLDIYQLDWPVMFTSNTFEDIRKVSRGKAILAIGIVLLLSLIVSIALIFKKKRSVQREYMELVSQRLKKRHVSKGLPVNSISIFGMFQVIDRNGNDISGRITAQQRDILLLILKYSASTGLSSERLSKLIWPDKELAKAKNSRGVAINRLRSELAEVDGINLLFEDGYYKIAVEEGAYCDFIEFDRMAMAKEMDVDKVLGMVSRGKFVGFCDNPIFDSWKGRVEDTLTFYLKDEIVARFTARDYVKVIEIADSLLEMDPLEESAMQYSVLALRALNHGDDAMVRYADFTSEYRKVNDEDYPIPFNRITKGISLSETKHD